MKKWVFISDLLFAFLAAFLPIVCLLRYFGLNLLLSIVAAALFGVGVAALVGFFKRKKHAKLLLQRGEEREKDLLIKHLALLSSKDSLSLLYPDSPVGQTDGIAYAKTEELTFAIFLWRTLTEEDVLPVIRICLKEGKRGKLVCNDLTPSASALLAQFSLTYEVGEEVYAKLKEVGRLPENYLSEPYFVKKKKRLTRIWFSKKNSRRFLTGAILLFLSSFLVPFPYYYIVFGCLMTVAAVLIRVLGYR